MKFALVNPNWNFTGSTYFGCRDPHMPLELMFAYDHIGAAGHEPREGDEQQEPQANRQAGADDADGERVHGDRT